MSKTEMHAFEKAMMDDAMLSDAVDGYREAFAETDVQKNIAEITKQLNTDPAKVVRGSFRQWMSIAAGLIVLLSTAVVLYRIFYHNDQEANITTLKTKTDSLQTAIASETKVDSNTIAANTTTPEVDEKLLPKPVIIPPAKSKSITVPTLKNTEIESNSYAKKEPLAPAPVTVKDNTIIKETKAAEDVAVQNGTAPIKLNKFIGRVVDANNQPLPFANVTEKNSGIGTYSDVNGNFVLLSADSVLNIQTKSFGYLPNSGYISSDVIQKITLKEEAVVANAPTQEVYYERYKKRMEKENADTADEVVAQPADGWSKFNLYVYNNQREPEEEITVSKQKKSREVQLAFDVNPDGTITNIKVEKSNCKVCNDEAIRLLKDGPRWKSKTGKKEITRLTMKF
jgi:outer membrane biosynthesis protein TonB